MGIATAILKALAYFGAWFCVQILVLFVATFIISAANPGMDAAWIDERINSLSLEINMLVGCATVLFLALVAYLRGSTLSKKALIRPYPPHFTVSFVLMGVAASFAIALVLSIALVSGIIPDSWIATQNDTYSDVRVASAFMQFLSVGFVAPVAEEILFRGFIFGTLKKEMPPAAAIVISALIFGIAHMTPLGIIYATALGILMGWLTWRTGSVVPSLLFHMAYNCTQAYSDGMSIILAVVSIPILVILFRSISNFYRGR